MSVYNIRASSWSSLFDCAYRFEGEQLLGMRRATSSRAALGRAIHASTALYDQSRIDRIQMSASDAAGALVDELQRPEEPIDWAGGDLSPREAERIGLNLHTMYCTDVSPRYQWEAVELTVTPLEIDCGGGTSIRLTGTLDRMRAAIDGTDRRIADLKTGKTAVVDGKAKTKGFRGQLGTYELLYEHTTGLAITAPAEIIGAKTSGKPEIKTAPVRDAKQLLIGTPDVPGYLELGAAYLRDGRFPPNTSSPLCDPRYCARWNSCEYRDK